LLRERTGDHKVSIEHHMRVLSFDQSRYESLRKLAELNALTLQWDQAVMWMKKYIQTAPVPIARYWALLGEYLVAGERYSEAFEALQAALDLEPYSYLARMRLAELLEKQGDTAQAIDHLEILTVYALDRDVTIYKRLGDLYIADERWNDAERVLQKGARIFPTDTAIYRALKTVEAY